MAIVVGLGMVVGLGITVSPLWAQSTALELDRAAVIAEIETQIRLLGDPDYFVREAAQARLQGFGADAVDALTIAQNHDDLEVATRARFLLRALKVEWTSEADPAAVRTALANYGEKGEQDRRERIGQLVRLPNGQGLIGLCRIVRYEPSLVLSKEAAVALLSVKVGAGSVGTKQIEAMQEALGSSVRAGARWVRAFIAGQNDVPEAILRFAAAAREETEVLQSNPEHTSPAIVLEVLRYYSQLCRQANQIADARQAMMQMIALEQGESPTLAALVDELIAGQEWQKLDELAVRFDDRIRQQATLLYLLAESWLNRDQGDKAKEFVALAQSLDPQDRLRHYQRAYQLGLRGLWEWSSAEREILMQIGWKNGSCPLEVDVDSPKVIELLHDYTQQSVELRKQRIQALSKLPTMERLSPLCRLVRFEESELLARLAAVAILNEQVVDDLTWSLRAEVILKVAGRESRPPIRWLLAYTDSFHRPDEAIGRFTELIVEEQAVLKKAQAEPKDDVTSPLVVQSLLRQQFKWYQRLDRSDAARQALLAMLQIETGEEESVRELVDLLLREEQWQWITDLEKQYPDTFQNQPLLLYVLAQAREKQGEATTADALATRALSFHPSEKLEHFRMAFELYRRGLTKWAGKEYQYLIDLGPAEDAYALNAKFRLAEILHDDHHHQAAAKMLAEALAIVQQDSTNRSRFVGDDPTWLPTRVHFFWSEHHAASGDRQRQRESLEQAISINPFDADVLISLYRLPGQTDADKAKTAELLKQAIQYYRDKIDEEPDSSTPYNQLAWLISNTTGDQDEALRCSLKSLELRPGTAGYLDTLGRVYFARKDYANAVKYQTMAVELDPYTPALSRQLKVFREAVAKQGKVPVEGSK